MDAKTEKKCAHSAVHLLCLIERAVLQCAMRGDSKRTRDRLWLHSQRLPRQGALAQKDNS
jgi:hypothetical protein